ncbi:tyrosine-type recombinase/integrase [Tatumella sp. JGM130]|uniref:site-specific integrase n=1 Tax=Tatumella sp. JGM130 TaxID=2799797 RepID=UPI001BAFE75C|nr:site-specific integrase [Tatumella sp. JGM130]MBS0895123.1 tyrosine-type recombinase/integrase [Tatumella sp. JGM130]
MSERKYPPGVESHGGYLRISFMYKGVRVREKLSVPDNAKNRNQAAKLRETVIYGIKTGTFDYASMFPASVNLHKFFSVQAPITLNEALSKWLAIKETEVAASTHSVYQNICRTILSYLSGSRMLDSVTVEDILTLRSRLLKGKFFSGRHLNHERTGRSVPFVNGCITLLSSVMKFAHESGYISRNVTLSVSPLKKDKVKPDPLTRDEFYRMIDSLRTRQMKNLWSLAVFTGMRHGELCALSWGDIDTKNRTISVRRNLTSKGYFTVPKTNAGIRKIFLIDAAWESLRDQMELTRMMPESTVSVIKREYGKKETEVLAFVFSPKINATKSESANHYSVKSLPQTWRAALKLAGIKDRKAYQSRHTYACWSLAAGANPNFIASQMGHTNSQMVHNVYGTWMPDNDESQRAILNEKLNDFVPSLPHGVIAMNN